jgi:ubiquinone/menaquinone biosynthesis C-methylase UbiE
MAPNRTIGDSNEEWRALAQQDDVLYNILSWPGKSGKWTEEEFYAAGESDWQDYKRHWLHYWPELGGTCVEIGTGAGRMTRALAGDFDRVVGLDVSKDMIELAGRVTPPNVELHVVDSPAIPLADDAADAVFSVHVLQHLDDFEAVTAYLTEARRVIRPGGSMMVHVTLGSGTRSARRRALDELRLWRSRRALREGGRATAVRMRVYQPEQVAEVLDQLGFEDVELRMFSARSIHYLHHFWLCRVPQAAS